MATSAAELLAANHVGGELYDLGSLCGFLGRAESVGCWYSLVLPILDRRLRTQHNLHPATPLPDLTTTTPTGHRDHGLLYPLRAVDRGADSHQRAAVGAEREREQQL